DDLVTGVQTCALPIYKRENHDRIEREINANLELAVKWETPALIVFSGNRNGLPDAAGIEITAEGLRRVAKSAEDAGVTLVLELRSEERRVGKGWRDGW